MAAFWSMIERLKAIVVSEHLLLWLAVAMAAVACLAVPGFATWWNAQTVMLYAFPLLVVSVGLTFVLISGGIDLSLTSIMAVVSVAGAKVMSGSEGLLGGSSLAIPAALLAMLAVGCALGSLNGLLVARFEIPSFIATLTLMMVASGFAVWVTRSEKIADLPPIYLEAGQNLPLVFLLVALLVGLAHILLGRSLFGQWLYMVGRNEAAARISGVPTRWTVFSVYVASGGFAALGSILLTAGLETGDPVMARNSLLDVVGATVLGGTSLRGGKGKVIWTVYGVLFLAVMDNILNLLNVNYYFITMSKGAVILLAASLDAWRGGRVAHG